MASLNNIPRIEKKSIAQEMWKVKDRSCLARDENIFIFWCLYIARTSLCSSNLPSAGCRILAPPAASFRGTSIAGIAGIVGSYKSRCLRVTKATPCSTIIRGISYMTACTISPFNILGKKVCLWLTIPEFPSQDATPLNASIFSYYFYL